MDPRAGQDILNKRQIFAPAINQTSEHPASSPSTILTELHQLQKEKHSIKINGGTYPKQWRGF